MKITNNAPPNPSLIDRAQTSEKTAEKSTVSETTARGMDKHIAPSRGSVVNISEDARLMKQAAETVKSIPDVRQDRVDSLKKQIQNGTYHVDSGAIADRLLAEHLGTNFGKNNI